MLEQNAHNIAFKRIPKRSASYLAQYILFCESILVRTHDSNEKT